MEVQSRKVGVATYHYSYNEGAILQAYATTQVLGNAAGVIGEIIDQRYPEKVKVYGDPDNDRKAALMEAINHWLPLSGEHFRETNDLHSIYDYINNTYDRLIIGSDVVWNLQYKRRLRRFFGKGILPRQSDPFFTPFPNLYWPNKALEVPVYAYAAAIGTLEYDQIPRSDQRKINNSLLQFAGISVRDERTRRFIEFINPAIAQDVELVPDPTFGIDLDLSAVGPLKKKLEGYGVDFSRPTCCFIAKDNPELKKFASSLKKQGCQTISLSTANSLSEINLFDKPISPLEWSVIFRFFDFCVTERMHGAIFCLKNKTPFIAIDINETTTDNDSKIVSLLRRFKATDYLVPKSKLNYHRLMELYTSLNENVEAYSDGLVPYMDSAKKTVRKYISEIAND